LNGRALIAFGGLLMLSLIACSTSSPKRSSEEASAIHLQLGLRYLNLGRLSEAKSNLKKSLSLDSHNAEAHNALAVLSERLKQYDEAAEHYEDALNIDSGDLSALNNYGRFLCERGEYDKGMSHLKDALVNPLNDRLWLALTNAGRCESEKGNLFEAEAYFRQALQYQPNYAPVLLEMQKLSYKKGDYWAAKGFMERYLASSQHSSESLWYAYQTERALGNSAAANELKKQLFDKFPLSDEAKKIITDQTAH
jgi:type IV pilus assembly protein PilF